MPPSLSTAFNANRLKVQLRLAVNRLKLIQQKKSSISAVQRKEIAGLLDQGKEESAKIRVEHIIREDFNIEAMEVIELYCELLLARFGLLESMSTCDSAIREAVHTIVYASQRCEVKELNLVRDQLAGKFGKSFLADALDNRNNAVNPRVVQKLKVETPDPFLVTQYLKAIAKSYNVDWTPSEELEQSEQVLGRHLDAKRDPTGQYNYYDASELPIAIPSRNSSTHNGSPAMLTSTPPTLAGPLQTTGPSAAPPGYIVQPHPYLANVMVTVRADQVPEKQSSSYILQPQTMQHSTQHSFTDTPGSLQMPQPYVDYQQQLPVDYDPAPRYISDSKTHVQSDPVSHVFPTIPRNSSPASGSGQSGDGKVEESDDDSHTVVPREDTVPDFDELTRRFEALKKRM